MSDARENGRGRGRLPRGGGRGRNRGGNQNRQQGRGAGRQQQQHYHQYPRQQENKSHGRPEYGRPPPPPRRLETGHHPTAADQRPAESSHQVEASADVKTFWRTIDTAMKNTRGSTQPAFTALAVDKTGDPALHLWHRTWAAAAAGAHGPLDSLLKALMQIPKRSGVIPSISDVVAVMLRAVASVTPRTTSAAALLLLERCLDVVHKRLQGQEALTPDPAATADAAHRLAEALRSKATLILPSFRETSLMTRCAALLIRTGEVVDPFVNALRQVSRWYPACMPSAHPCISGLKIHSKLNHVLALLIGCCRHAATTNKEAASSSGPSRGLQTPSLTIEAGPAWTGWREPRMQWLLEGSWLRQVPDLCSSYSSTVQYTDALHHLMVLLTFYWGAGAVWPRCMHRRGHDSCCGEPLLSVCSGNKRTKPCTTRVAGGRLCGMPAVWSCPRWHHDDAICVGCLERKQKILIGAPGQHAATDIYDAVVEAEWSRRDGPVFLLSQVRSRRPPREEPRWKTSYRLKCSALVAVASLASSQEHLSPSTPLTWAEVVPVVTHRPPGQQGSGPDWDWQERARGRMAVRLLCCDQKGHIRPSPHATLSVGMRIAVIDLRIFVPEVLSVLSICADPTLTQQLDAIPFAQRLIGNGAPPRELIFTTVGDCSPEGAVAEALRSSDIEVVQRLSPEARHQLAVDVGKLARRANLYGTQLDAFAQALHSSVHCTQGPPGTGKSYVGVQLILALDLIRDAAIKDGHTVGPILALSYKNHALDEILLDVLEHANRLKLGLSKPRALVRCGNAEAPKLRDYTEQRTYEEKYAQDVLHRRLEVVRDVDRLVVRLRDLAGHVELCAAELEHHSAVSQQHAIPTMQVLGKWLPAVEAGHENGQMRPLDCVTAAVLQTIPVMTLLANLKGKLQDHLESAAAQAPPPPNIDECESRSEEAGPVEPSGHELATIIGGCQGAFHLLEKLPQSLLEARDPLLDKLLPGLSSELEHWLNYQQRRDIDGRILLLGTWLSGSAPPPRCSALMGPDDRRCMLQAGGGPCNTPFCHEIHACRHPEGCALPRVEGVKGLRLCEHHRCHESTATCSRLQLPGSPYCRRHSCPLCMSDGVEVVREARPHACEAHQCQVLDCTGLQAAAAFPFCLEHACVLCLQAGEWLDKQAVEGTRLCARHKCRAMHCVRPVLLNPETSSSSCLPPLRQSFCRVHACAACEGVKNLVDPGSSRNLCREHRCSHLEETGRGLQLCQAPRLKDSLFCIHHTCRVCLDQGCPLVHSVTDVPPRNVCEGHRLCCNIQRDGAQCMSFALPGVLFCSQHSAVQRRQPQLQQQSLSPLSASSKSSVAGRQQPSSSSAAVESENVQQRCSGTNRLGKQCKTKVYGPRGRTLYCDAHAAQAPPPLSSSDDEDDFVDFEDASEMSQVSSDADDMAHQFIETSLDIEELQKGGYDTSTGLAAMMQTGWQIQQQHRPDGIEGCAEEDNCDIESDMDPDGQHVVQEAAMSSHPLRSLPWDLPLPPPLSPALPPSKAKECQQGTAQERTYLGKEAEPDQPKQTDEQVAEAPDSVVKKVEEQISQEKEEGIDDNVVMPEALEANVHPDEMMLSEDEDAEHLADETLSVNEEQERLRDMLGDDDDEMELLESEDITACGLSQSNDMNVESAAALQALFSDLQGWGWGMQPAQRCRALAAVLRKGGALVALLRRLSEGFIEDARQDVAAASASALRRARVIGATVVGAARRLEALRAAEPFAMVVEEACEVMEPTLMAVLAVGSLRKLELVGDHYQLPAFVQNCWFNIDTSHPSIKVSLFERLVTASSHGAKINASAAGRQDPERREEPMVHCSILDEQRRMRSSIADLTRGQYSHLVDIKDHPCTATRLLGDSVLQYNNQDAPLANVSTRNLLQRNRKLWNGGGLLAPGVLPQEFFWDLAGNLESKVGLSACNPVEAKAAARLAGWHSLCGVPGRAISIITPYKGQKTTIIKELRNIKEGQSNLADEVVVSTVDRYQGDENDVVILSLVRTQPGNRFVALKNRFIVAASRARIAFYILGSTEAVKGRGGSPSGPSHWQGLLESMGRPAGEHLPDSIKEQDLGQDEDCVAEKKVDDGVSQADLATSPGRHTGPRVGTGLPVCCPQHPGVQRLVVQVKDFPQASTWDDFCREPCGQPLRWCGHQCSQHCHAPNPENHRKPEACQEILQRPCEDHKDIPLSCGDVYRGLKASTKGAMMPLTTLTDALAAYKCEEIIYYQRPECDHTVQIPCWKHKEIVAGTRELSPCVEKVRT